MQAGQSPAVAEPPSKPAAQPASKPADQAAPAAQPTAVDDPSQPLSRRILGRWRMNLAEIPDLALTPELLKVKRKGMGDKVQVDYTITETHVIVERGRLGPAAQERWDYEILRESGDEIVLKRTDKRGKSVESAMRIEDGLLWVGTEGGKVPLKRVQ